MADKYDAELDGILDQTDVRAVGPVGRPIEQVERTEAKAKLSGLLRRVEVEARRAELLNMPFNDGRFSAEWIEKHWAARIEKLDAELQALLPRSPQDNSAQANQPFHHPSNQADYRTEESYNE